MRSTPVQQQNSMGKAAFLLGLSIFVSNAYGHGESHAPAAATRSEGRSTTEVFWTALPAISPGGGRAERGQASLVARNLSAPELLVYSPNDPELPAKLTPENNRWLVSPSSPDKGGHHWLIAREIRGDTIVTATTAWTFPAKGDAPTRLLKQQRSGLEIVPDHIPEHGGMREGEDWAFHVRYDGAPLAGTVVRFETESGTRSRVITDAQGVAHIAFPRDIDPAEIDPQAGATRTRKGFVLAAEHQHGETHHLSAFNFFYYPDLMRERSLSGGVGFLALGILLALPLLRRKETGHA